MYYVIISSYKLTMLSTIKECNFLSCSPFKYDKQITTYYKDIISKNINKSVSSLSSSSIVKRLKSYLDNPENILNDTLIGLSNNNIIDKSTYNLLKQESTGSINDRIDSIINNNTNWSYIIGNFKISNNSYGLVKLYSGDTISNKFISIQVNSNNIYINGQSNLKIIQIEENSNIIPNNIKKCIKICEIFNHYNCKKCNVLLKVVEPENHCSKCKKNAVKIIESNWINYKSNRINFDCIYNPDSPDEKQLTMLFQNNDQLLDLNDDLHI